jgi:hypothetical protein
MKLTTNGAEVEVDDRHARTPLLRVLQDLLGMHTWAPDQFISRPRRTRNPSLRPVRDVPLRTLGQQALLRGYAPDLGL